jgi:hypothetical protein
VIPLVERRLALSSFDEKPQDFGVAAHLDSKAKSLGQKLNSRTYNTTFLIWPFSTMITSWK